MVMKKFMLRLIVLLGSLSLLPACLGPKTPQEVTKAFWVAVIENNAKDAVSYSTLTDTQYYDGFSTEWRGYQPSLGKVVIEGEMASVVTTLESPPNSGADNRKFVTYLVQRNDAWLVDYNRTSDSVHGGALGALFGTLSRMGNDLSAQMQSSADDFKADMERMSKELEEMSSSLSQQASESIERYAQELRESIRAMIDSINRALEENDDLSPKDRRTLKEVAADLDNYNEDLADPTAASVAEGSKNLGRAQQRLQSIDGASTDAYKQEWNDLAEGFDEALRKLLKELSVSSESKGERL